MKISKMVDALQYIDEDLVAEAITYRPDEKTMDEIIKISEGNGEEKAMRKKGKIAKRTLLVAALIAVLVLGTLTVAVAAFRGILSKGLKNLFHISAEQEEDLLGREDDFLQIYETEDIYIKDHYTKEESDQGASGNEAEQITEGTVAHKDQEKSYVLSETYEGITVSVKETLVDSYYVNIVLCVNGFSKEQASEIEFGRLGVWAEGESLGSMSGSKDVLDDGTIEYTLSYNAAKGSAPGWFLGRDVEVIWENMSVRDESMKKRPVLQHTWHLTWTLEGMDARQVWELNIALGESGAIVESVELTDASIRVNYIWPRQTVPVVLQDGSIGNELKEPPILCGIIMKDGTVHTQVMDGGGSGYHDGSLQKYYTERKLANLFNPNEVESILFQKENPDDSIPAVDGTPLKIEECFVIKLQNGKLCQENVTEEISHDNLDFYCNGIIARWSSVETKEENLRYGFYVEGFPENHRDELEVGTYEVYVGDVLLTESSLEERDIEAEGWFHISSDPRPRKDWTLTVVPADMGATMDDYIEKQLKLVIHDLVTRDSSGKEKVIVKGRWELRHTIQIYQ